MHLREKYKLLKGKVEGQFRRTSSISDVGGSTVSNPSTLSSSLLNEASQVGHAAELALDSLPEPTGNGSHTAPAVGSSHYANLPSQASEIIESDMAPRSAWTSLKGLTQAISQLAGGFGPLKVLMEDILRSDEAHESSISANREYVNLRSRLEVIFEDLRGYYSGDEPPAMTTSMQNLCRAIEGELEAISRDHSGDAVSLYFSAKSRQDEVIECYRRIHGHFERFRLNASINVWRILEKQTVITTSMQKTFNKQALEALLNKLMPSTSAYYNSAEAAMLNRRDCTRNTRTEVLRDLGRWISSNTDSKIFWLNGMAGTGKTTIANTLCATLDQSLSLGASFFCSHQLPECRNVKLIIPTLAHQLARYSSPFSAFLVKALDIDPEVHTRALRIQFEHMIVGPLREVARTMPEALVIVMDALDECDDKNGVGQLLELIVKHSPELPVKFFVSSRPEPQIRKRMTTIDSRMILHDLDHQIVREDIKTYLEVELKPASPSDSDLVSLTDRAGVLFIYAATVVRYIGARGFSLNPKKRLATVLDTSSGASNRTRDMDALYQMILASALDDPELEVWDRELVKLVLDTVICAQEPLSASGLSKLLKLDSTERIHDAIESLWSVLHITRDDVITTLHASFPDYILDLSRSKTYGCHALVHHGFLALRCFDRIKTNSTQFNICQLESSFIPDESVVNLESRVAEAIPLDLWYACKYWISHLLLAETSSERAQALHIFLSEHILLWMEIMNLKNQIGLGARLMERANKFCIDKSLPQNTSELARDAWRFVSTFAGNPVSISTPHIYVSMLASWPRDSPLGGYYIPRTRGLIRVEGSRMSRRQPLLLSVFSMNVGVTCFTLSPDSAYIISGAWDNSIRVWDARTGHAIGRPLKGHADWINSVAFSPNGAYIASGSSDTTVRLWDARTGRMISSPLRGHADSVQSVAFSPSGARVVSGSADATIRIWDVKAKHLIGSPLVGHTGSINSVVFSSDGRIMASASDDKTIIIWDAETGLMMGSPLKGHSHQVLSVDFSPNGMHIVSSSRDMNLMLWDSRTGQAIGGPLKGHTAAVNSATFSPDGTLLISSSDDNTLRLWDPQTGQVIGSPLKCHSRRVYSSIFSADGARIISASADKTIRVWDAQTKPPPASSLDGHDDWVLAVAFSTDGTRIVSSSKDKTIRIWDAVTGQAVGSPLRGHTGSVNSVAFLPNGTHIASGSEDATIRIWDVLTGLMIGCPLKGHRAAINSVSVSSDGTHIASGSYDGEVRVWDAQVGQPVGSPLNGHSESVTSVVFSPDGLLVASGSWDKSVRLWDIRTGQLIGAPLSGHSGSVNSIVFSPDGACVLSGSSDRTVRMWNTRTKNMVFQSLEFLAYPIASVCFSPDGSYFISGSNDGTIHFWDTQSGRPIGGPIYGHTSTVNSVMLSSDGTRIVSGSEDTTLRLWAIPGGLQSFSYSESFSTSIVKAHTPGLPRDPSVTLGSTKTYTDMNLRGHPTASWILDDDQWVRGRQSQLLIWIPHDLRDTLVRPHNLHVISSEGSTRLDFSNAKIGDSWVKCYSQS
ncbi:unnamed protein product [Rhizoctonia solani]|uniref:Nephrocystin 3-like N-terminal domain-containing protein n=1 Tax=Rhizoctonia solani TaxID=456999 RepID=A0A8H3D0X8_9AGAM|nr:unnamed protein product [Rhizoctonia solani]